MREGNYLLFGKMSQVPSLGRVKLQVLGKLSMVSMQSGLASTDRCTEMKPLCFECLRPLLIGAKQRQALSVSRKRSAVIENN